MKYFRRKNIKLQSKITWLCVVATFRCTLKHYFWELKKPNSSIIIRSKKNLCMCSFFLVSMDIYQYTNVITWILLNKRVPSSKSLECLNFLWGIWVRWPIGDTIMHGRTEEGVWPYNTLKLSYEWIYEEWLEAGFNWTLFRYLLLVMSRILSCNGFFSRVGSGRSCSCIFFFFHCSQSSVTLSKKNNIVLSRIGSGCLVASIGFLTISID